MVEPAGLKKCIKEYYVTILSLSNLIHSWYNNVKE